MHVSSFLFFDTNENKFHCKEREIQTASHKWLGGANACILKLEEKAENFGPKLKKNVHFKSLPKVNTNNQWEGHP